MSRVKRGFLVFFISWIFNVGKKLPNTKFPAHILYYFKNSTCFNRNQFKNWGKKVKILHKKILGVSRNFIHQEMIITDFIT